MPELTLRPTGWAQDLTASKRGNAFNVEIVASDANDDEDILVIALVRGKTARAVTMFVKKSSDLSSSEFHVRNLMPALHQLKRPVAAEQAMQQQQQPGA
jgi:hypothetical protein